MSAVANFEYRDNSTERMLSLLSPLSIPSDQKIACFDDDSRSIPPSYIGSRPNLCFIDGEHTPTAVVADFDFCLSVCAPEPRSCFMTHRSSFEG